MSEVVIIGESKQCYRSTYYTSNYSLLANICLDCAVHLDRGQAHLPSLCNNSLSNVYSNEPHQIFG